MKAIEGARRSLASETSWQGRVLVSLLLLLLVANIGMTVWATTGHRGEGLWPLAGDGGSLVAATLGGMVLYARRRLMRSVAAPLEQLITEVRGAGPGEPEAPLAAVARPMVLAELGERVRSIAGALRAQTALAEQREAEARAATRRLAGVLEAARHISGSFDFPSVMGAVSSAARELGAERARIWLADGEGWPLELVFDSDTGPGRAGTALAVMAGHRLAVEVMLTGLPAGPTPLPAAKGALVAFGVPLVAGDKVFGVLECTAQAHEQSDDVTEAMGALAIYAAMAIELARVRAPASEVPLDDQQASETGAEVETIRLAGRSRLVADKALLAAQALVPSYESLAENGPAAAERLAQSS